MTAYAVQPRGTTTLAAVLAEEVRVRVRDEGVDPQSQASAVRSIAESVVQAHDRRSLTGAVHPVEDLAGMVEEMVSRVSGFGALQRHLDDPSIEEVWINEPSRVFVARHGRHELTSTLLSGEEVRELVERMLKTSGRRLDLSQPFVDALLPGGHRLHVVLDGIARGFAAVNIRKFVARANNLDQLVQLGSLTTQAAAFLRASVQAGLNIVVSGGTQAGKTTMLNCLAAAIPGTDRVISAEEVFELPKDAILQTCAPWSIPASHSIGQAGARLLTGSARTARSCALSVAGPSCRSSLTTTSRRHRPSNARPTSRCWQQLSVGTRRCWLPGTSTA